MSSRGRLTVFLFAPVLALATAAPARAQQYPPPAAAEDSCFVVSGKVGDEYVVGQAEHRGLLRAEGSEGCATSFGNVDVSAAGVFLGSITAHEDGSFMGTFRLPASVRPGTRTVVGDIDGRGEVSRTIEVIGATVLGTSETRTSAVADGAGGGGVLPRTGGDILLLVLWALLLIALGTATAIVARRWREGRVAVVAGTPSGRLGDVPFFDTSRFAPSPVQHHRADDTRVHRAAPTEWDAQRRDRQV